MNRGVGKTIQEIRKVRGLSQKELAEMVGTSQAYISALERGKQNPSMDTYIKIAEQLKVPREVLEVLSLDLEKIPEERRVEYMELFLKMKSFFRSAYDLG